MSKKGENFFGRTMDFSYDIEPSFYIFPKNQAWKNQINNNTMTNKYGILAIGQEADGMLGIFDGVNDNGFAAAALYFPGFAKYNESDEGKIPIASIDLLLYLLGNCGSVNEIENILSEISIMGISDPITQTVAPLHWIATDKSGKCAVIEQTANGLQIFDNHIGVLANSPNFQWQITNLRNYTEINEIQKNEAYWGNQILKPFGQGGGSSLLPGGYTSPARFVRTAFIKTHTTLPENESHFITTCFNIMNSVTVTKGIVLTDRSTYDYTKYTAFVNVSTGEYYFKTYYGNEIIRVNINDYNEYDYPVYLGKLNSIFSFRNFNDM